MQRGAVSYQRVETLSHYEAVTPDFNNLDDVTFFRRPRVQLSEVDYEQIHENRGVLEILFDPHDDSKILIGDIRYRDKPDELYVPSLSVGGVVAHSFLDGLKTLEDGRHGIFSFYNIRAAAYRDLAVTTAGDLNVITGEDLITYGGYDEMVILGSYDRGPVFGFTREEWMTFVNEVNNPDSVINEFVWWADEESAKLSP